MTRSSRGPVTSRTSWLRRWRHSLPPSDRPYTGTGFRSTTRIAAGPADLWVGILAENAPAVVAALAEVQAKLAEFAAALQPPQPATLKMLLEAAKTTRESLEE